MLGEPRHRKGKIGSKMYCRVLKDQTVVWLSAGGREKERQILDKARETHIKIRLCVTLQLRTTALRTSIRPSSKLTECYESRESRNKQKIIINSV